MRVLCLSLLLVSIACGSDDRRPGARLDGGAPDAANPTGDAAPADAPPFTFDAGDGLDDVQVWAHSPRELYRFDPRTNEVSYVGRFVDEAGEPADDMTDLAVDGFGNLYTCSFTELFRVDPATAVVTRVGSLGDGADARFNALTFAPAGELDPTSEVLIAANAEGDIYRVDPTTGASASVGRFSDGFGSSGDIVSVLGAGTYVTAFREDLETDWLIRVDLRTGVATPIGETGTVRLFGLAYWRNRLYGFNSLGWLFVIDVDTGRATRISGDTGASTFFGAGVTTNAPTAPI